ncbi:tetratricopeptide repeat protein 16 [Colossoma macropomum]|uniref:tetratricopeptide repeat protein 16 n=1 Tax=Colossoma macropomum TaxID=42526 RepID=UPI001864CC27|nr:tetratricopeptide repeat protein 16 [Colossoma macropomum]
MSAQKFSEVDTYRSDLKNTSQEAAIQKLFGSSSIFLTPELKRDRPELQGILVIKEKANTHYQAGKEAVIQLQFERAVSCFSKAITLQPDQTQLYVERAEVYLQLCDFNSAALDYKHACYLEPQTKTHFHRLAFIYYLKGQCLCDQGMFLDALESFAKATELKPNFKPYHMRSLACLSALGRYSDCIRLVTNWLKTDAPSADLFTLRARLYHQINQAALCYYDLKAALRLNPSCADALSLLEEMKEAAECSQQQAVSKAVEGELTDALSKITTAVEKNPEKAQYYLFRGILYRRLKDFIAAIEDLVLAVELSDAGAECCEREKPDNSNSLEEDAQAQLVLTYNDFAVHCFSQGFYSEAIMLLTKAIHEQRDESGLFINRGDCFLKQEEWLFALADYQQAEELDPQNRSIWFRLALIHNTLGLHCFGKLNFQDAADKFSLAIRYNPGVAQYYGNRAKAQTRMHKMEEAKLDALSALILGPTNDELVPLLLRLFPGCSLSDVISSATAQTVKAQLMERTQMWKLAGRLTSRLSDKLQRMALQHDTDSQSETASQSSLSVENVETKLKPCVSPQDLLSSKEQVIQAVKKVLHQRQSLYHTGPRLSPLCLADASEAALCAAKHPYAWRNFRGLGLNC